MWRWRWRWFPHIYTIYNMLDSISLACYNGCVYADLCLHFACTWNLKLELKPYLCMCALAVCNICENLFQHIFLLLLSPLRFIVLESMLLCFHLFHVFTALIFFCHFSWWFPITKSSIILNPIIMVRSNIGFNVEIKSKKKYWINVVHWHRTLSYDSPLSREKWMMDTSNKQSQTLANNNGNNEIFSLKYWLNIECENKGASQMREKKKLKRTYETSKYKISRSQFKQCMHHSHMQCAIRTPKWYPIYNDVFFLLSQCNFSKWYRCECIMYNLNLVKIQYNSKVWILLDQRSN